MAETQGGSWQTVFIPLFPPGAEPRGGLLHVILKTAKAKDQAGLQRLALQPALTGVIVNSVTNLGFKQKAELSEQYPFADLGAALILEHDYLFPTTAVISLYIAGCAALWLIGLGSVIALVVLAMKPRPKEFAFLEQ